MSKYGKHSTVTSELKKSMRWLESFECVEKIVLGISEGARHCYKPGTLRYQKDALGGIKLKAYSGNGVVDVYVKVDAKNKTDLLAKIAERFSV